MKKEIHIRWQLFFYDAFIFALVNALLAFLAEHLTPLGFAVLCFYSTSFSSILEMISMFQTNCKILMKNIFS